jgi:hypothetical protein
MSDQKTRDNATYLGQVITVKATPKTGEKVIVPSLNLIGEAVGIYEEAKGLLITIKHAGADGIDYTDVKTITNEVFVVVEKVSTTKLFQIIKHWFLGLFKKK